MKRITVPEVEYVAHRLAGEMMDWGEPIPSFETRFPGILEGCLALPFQTFARKALYKGFIGKASILLYLMIKNHPFQNGNKRVAIVTLLYFLFRNGKWMKIDNQELYNFAKWVAESNPKLKNETVKAIEKFIKTYAIKLDGVTA